MNAEFVARAGKLADWIKQRNDFSVIYNYDADGISAGAIVCKSLERLAKTFFTKPLKQLYREEILKLKPEFPGAENFIFVDFGSGQKQELKEIFAKWNSNETDPKLDYIIIDHHQPTKEHFELELNPLLFGVDGGNEISAAGTSFLVARELDIKNADLAGLAIVGACGDVQDGQGKLIGTNAEILKIAEQAGVVKKETDLRLYGRMTRPLIQFLMFSSSPIIPNLTANEQNCIKFLSDLGIPLKNNEHWRSYDGLLPDEKKKLSSALLVHLHSFNVPEWKLNDLIGEVYTLANERRGTALRDAKEFGTLLNACGRHRMAEIGLKVCMGDRGENLLMASSLLLEHRRQLSEGIRLMQEEGLNEFDTFYFFDAGERIKDSIIGIVAGMLYGSGTISPNKPIVALSKVDDKFSKASARATKDLVLKGLNLGKIFKEMQADFGQETEGGGHAIAAGIKFPSELKNYFLEELQERIKNQLGSGIRVKGPDKIK